jgi:hypothetical protein
LDVAIEDFKTAWARAKETENWLRDLLKAENWLEEE